MTGQTPHIYVGHHPAIYNALHTQPWATSSNPPSEYQFEVIKYIYYLALDAPTSAQQVARMPFLQEIDQEDYLAVRALRRAARHGFIDEVLAFYQELDGIKDHDRTRLIAASTNNSLEGILHRLGKRVSVPADTRVPDFLDP